jgi:glycosyltransferase involved in cell wall biosynthesis
MKKILPLLLLCGSLLAEEKPFVVVIPSYNNKDWYDQNLSSVFSQRYENYRVIYVTDGCTDDTARLVEQYVEDMGEQHRFLLIENSQHNGPLACLAQGVYLCDKNEIVVDLDGNDWLSHDEVLEDLNNIYSNPDIWMTYGQFISYPYFVKGFAAPIPEDVIQENKFRSFGGAVTHLKTFYAGLFHQINKEDLLFEGKFIRRACDLAYITPLLELSGRHTKFISDVLYVYNKTSPLNDHKSSDEWEEEMDRFVRSKEKYSPLSDSSFLGYENNVAPGSIYSRVDDLFHPSLADYRIIQDYLANGYRENIDRLNDMERRMRELRIIGTPPNDMPSCGTLYVNCDENYKENCVLIYATFNMGYPKGFKRILQAITDSDFKGHILYRIGGWPNTEGGDLVLSHVPYAFKVSFFREAERLGYKRALWLDTPVVPLVSLNDIFARIQEKGYFVVGNTHRVGPYVNAKAAAFFGLSLEETYSIPSCSAGLFGVDFSHKTSKNIINWLYHAALDKDAFFSTRSDQNALSMILYLNHISDFVPLSQVPEYPHEINSDSLFWLDRIFVYQ